MGMILNIQVVNLLYYPSDRVYFVETKKGDESGILNKCLQIM